MNVFHKVALQGLKKNRTRTFVTIIGVALSAALFTAVATFGTSLLQYLVRGSSAKYGGWYVEFVDVDAGFVQQRGADAEVTQTTAFENIGYAVLDGAKSPEKPYLFVAGFGADAFDELPVTLISGRLPENDTEVLVPNHVAMKAGVQLPVGECLSLALGSRTAGGQTLTQHDPYTAGETLTPTAEKRYTVVGTYDRAGFEEHEAPGYTLITKVNGQAPAGRYSLALEGAAQRFQNDPKCYEEGIDFMFGDSLLVANVVEKGAATRSLYLPEGDTFYDYYTREAYAGGQTIEFPVDLGSIPLFVRSGAIIPMAVNQMKNLMTEQPTGISLLCAADKDGAFDLYEDDGTTMDYENGGYVKTTITMTAGERTIIDFKLEGDYTTSVETMEMDMIHREKAPYWITVDGETLPHFLHRRKFAETDCGWYYSQRLKSVQVKYPNPKKDYKVVVSFEQFDLIGM